ncbi:PREDICTED: villin-like protein quail [Ceratosolen solmsi marchali]|uniref:Villin-like protein quail n=1 Tax=Ceratosolen solmsi marchali TaxID=326594 RepID=A0AAJ6YWA2_9HYME|nr:PREDICTED: villin-like protein quail [Ceratosolen solmsi marchali]
MGFLKRDDASSCSDESNVDIFRSIPKASTAFSIWKIEGLRIISLGRTKVGTFLSDSAYLLYAASDRDGVLPYPNMPTKELKNKAAVRAIHFWVGADCDMNVSGAAARAAAELDSRVAATILMREAQGRESPRFHAYFRQRSINVEGQSVEDDYKCSLHRVTGTALPVLTQLTPVDWSSFSSRDVILLDVRTRSVIFLWLGSKSDPLHKSHALRLLDEQKKTKNGEETRIFIVEDGYEQTLQPEARKLFNEILDLSVRFVSPEPLIESYQPSASIKLYKCNELNGKYKVAELKSGPIFRSDLESSAVFLLERGEAGVWAWVGKDASAKERLEAVRNARGFVKKKGYGPCVPVARALEAREPPEMRSWVKGWPRSCARPLILPTSFEPDYMAERPRMAAECQLVDDGNGERTLWRVEHQTGLVLLKDSGVFYAEACYLLRYKYGYGRRSRTIIYHWEGAESMCNDKEAAIEAACNLSEDESAQLIITSQGNEPPHLLQMYNGKLIILNGPHRDAPPKKYLVRVYGSTPYTSKAVERPLRANSLDSGGVFILFSNLPMVWCGSKSTGDAREASRRLAPATAPLICEGKEDDEFWTQLEGKGVCNVESVESEGEDMDKHFYHLKIEKSMFTGEEILGFAQNSLIPEASWLLDAGSVIWIWIGSYCAPKPLKDYIEEAKIFLHTHPVNRDRSTIISIIKQGLEPPTFIGLFDNWNHNLLRDYRPFNALRASVQERDALINDITAIKIISEFAHFVKYPLKILKNDPENLPPGVDVSRKEMHLTFDDFMTVFKMEPTEFEKLPTWRRQRLKQTAGLF